MHAMLWGWMLVPILAINAAQNVTKGQVVATAAPALTPAPVSDSDSLITGEAPSTAPAAPPATTAPKAPGKPPVITTGQIEKAEAVAGAVSDVAAAKDPLAALTKKNPSTGQTLGDALLGSLGGGIAAPQKTTKISNTSKLIVRGVIEGFLNHLDEDEQRCLEKDTGRVVGDVTQAGEDLVRAIMNLVPAVKKKVPFMTAVMSADVIGKVTDAGSKVLDLVGKCEDLVKGCVKPDAMKMLNKTADHLKNLTFLADRLVVNTVNITKFLADSIIEWDKKDYLSFGNDIGTTLRKILLSTNSATATLPEGMPPQKILEETLEGMLMGFFVKGTTLDIINKTTGAIKVEVDLKQCIADNHMFFRSAWKTVFFMIAQLQNLIKENNLKAQYERAGLEAPDNLKHPIPGQEWMGQIMMAVTQIPGILMSCNVNMDTSEMFSDTHKAVNQNFDNTKIELNMARFPINMTEVSLRVYEAAAFWDAADFDRLGVVIGILLRDLVLLAFPEKYEVDSTGLLKKRILRENSMWQGLQHQTGSATFNFGLGIFAAITMSAILCRAFRVFKASRQNAALWDIDEEAPLRPASTPLKRPVASSSMLMAELEIVE